MSDDFIQVATTFPDQPSAQRVAQYLIEQRLAACVQISGPIRSTYRWQGQIESANEYQCLAKIRASRFAQVAEAIQQRHSYEVPELVAVPLTHIANSYRLWLEKELP